MNGKASEKQGSRVKAWTEADSLRALAANKAREELGKAERC